jgi:beta-mannosidase
VRDVIEVQSFISRHAWLRKTACGFGWDWGPAFPSVAVGRVVLECRNAPRIRSVRVVQHHDPGGDVTLELQPEVEPGVPDPGWRVTVSQDGAECARADRLSLRLPRPRLWWPNGMGSQPLYDILVELLDDQGGAVATVSKRIGLRTVSLLQEPDPNGLGRGFSFRVNGRPSFAKGANWIPPDLFSWESAPDTTRTILKGAAAAKMNMVRVWGGGRYETDTFYDTCDELGLLVWQDFMFACGSYPAWDEAWLGNVAIEADDPVRRLAHHACLALWCGNNEIEHNFVGDRWAHEKRLWTDKVMGRAD